MSTTTNDLISNIQNGFTITTDEQFNIYIDLFLNEELKDLRLNLYKNIEQQMNFSNPAEAKHAILKQLFSDFVHNSLTQANLEANNDNTEKATSYVNNLYKLREVFKNHDVVNFQEFLVESDRNITELEVELLFSNPVLNKSEINKLTTAFISAFGKKYKASNSKSEYQKKLFSHPLLPCIASNNDYNNLLDNIKNKTLQLGNYENLILTILESNVDIHQEQFQGFIAFVISQDITLGFSNILKLDKYEPKLLKELLVKITNGEEVKGDFLQSVINQVAKNHTVNYSVDANSQLKESNHSNKTLNDAGFKTYINDLLTILHLHETSGSGKNQFSQQSNTARILRKFFPSTIGLTVTKDLVTKRENANDFLNQNQTSSLLNLNIMEEVLLSGLQFDCAHFQNLCLLANSQTELTNSDFLSSNNYLIKSNLDQCLNIIFNNIEKNDLILICEKKNAYMHLVEKNIDFFKANLAVASTENEMVYQLISGPLTDLFAATLELEENNQIKLLSDNDILLIQELCNVNAMHFKIEGALKKINKAISKRDISSYEDISCDQYSGLKNLMTECQHFGNTINNKDKSIKVPKNNMILSFLSKPNSSLQDCNEKISHLLATDFEYIKKHRKELTLLLQEKMEQQLPLLLPNSKKQKGIIQDLNEIVQNLVTFKKATCNSHNTWQTSLTSLFSQSNKTENQKQNEQVFLQSMFNLMTINKSKIVTYNPRLANKFNNGK